MLRVAQQLPAPRGGTQAAAAVQHQLRRRLAVAVTSAPSQQQSQATAVLPRDDERSTDDFSDGVDRHPLVRYIFNGMSWVSPILPENNVFYELNELEGTHKLLGNLTASPPPPVNGQARKVVASCGCGCGSGATFTFHQHGADMVYSLASAPAAPATQTAGAGV